MNETLITAKYFVISDLDLKIYNNSVEMSAKNDEIR